MRKFTLTLALGAILPLIGSAQHYLGLATSNWSGTNAVYLNPANIADSRTKFSLDLVSFNLGVDNNLATIKASKVTGGDYKESLTFSTKDKFSIVLPQAEIRLPGFMYSINRKHSIALTTRIRVLNQFDNFNQSLYRNITDSSFDPQQGSSVKADHFNWTAHAWSEFGLSYAGVIWENGANQIKGGFTVRYMLGAGYYSVTSNNIDASYKYDSVKHEAYLSASNTDIHYARGGVDFLGNSDAGDLLKNFGKSAGTGFGGDLGFVYEYRPDYKKYQYDMDGKTGLWDARKNKYLLRLSVAVTDLGSIKYSDGNKQINFTGNGTLVGSELLQQIGSYDSMRAYFLKNGFKADSGTGNTTKVHMPTALRIGLDVHAIGGLYVNALYIGNMTNRSTPGNSFYSQITLTPRYDTRFFSLGIPLTYSMLTSSIKAGLGVRLGGFFFGSDDALAFTGGSANGVNFYFGAFVPINKKRPRDSDHDGVSNRHDKCPKEPGTWEFKGCPNPDKDGDGVLDSVDKCPDVAGSKATQGCPDADGDGIADAEDRCPQEAGSAAMQGCPDKDNDGIADMDDACPDVAGIAKFKGCPDSDGDGIVDSEDQCPNEAGTIANHGCPNRDADNDGVLDQDDKCPNVAGPASNHGCPEVSVTAKTQLNKAATAIQFETGKAAIKKTSYAMLDGIVKILNDYPEYNMSIEGHTDNAGKPEKNLQLSKDRAASVKAYFVSKGIDGNRISSEGYGDTKPVAPNKTAAGRAKNRRVVMGLKLKD